MVACAHNDTILEIRANWTQLLAKGSRPGTADGKMGTNKLLWDRNRAGFAHPDYDAWWRCWEAEGWVSLGRARDFDWMHVQAARV